MNASTPASAGTLPAGGGQLKQLADRLRLLEHAMRTPVGTLAASLQLLQVATDPQSLDAAAQTMARQIRLLTSQLEQLHDIGRDLAEEEGRAA